VDSFLDHHCVGMLRMFSLTGLLICELATAPVCNTHTVFDPGEENKFSYTEVYKEYQTMVCDILVQRY